MTAQIQTREQFLLLHGDRTDWSKTTKAVFSVLFDKVKRVDAVAQYGVSSQTIGAFMKKNKYQHIDRVQYAAAAYKTPVEPNN